MFHILIFILLLGLSLILMVVLGTLGFLRSLFRKNTPNTKQYTNTTKHNEPTKIHHKEKIFKKEEGDYVDFEEIKD